MESTLQNLQLRPPQVVKAFTRAGYPLHFVTLGDPDALAEAGYVMLAGVPDPLRARLQRRSH